MPIQDMMETKRVSRKWGAQFWVSVVVEESGNHCHHDVSHFITISPERLGLFPAGRQRLFANLYLNLSRGTSSCSASLSAGRQIVHVALSIPEPLLVDDLVFLE